jgi:hypothetical protein
MLYFTENFLIKLAAFISIAASVNTIKHLMLLQTLSSVLSRKQNLAMAHYRGYHAADTKSARKY